MSLRGNRNHFEGAKHFPSIVQKGQPRRRLHFKHGSKCKNQTSPPYTSPPYTSQPHEPHPAPAAPASHHSAWACSSGDKVRSSLATVSLIPYSRTKSSRFSPELGHRFPPRTRSRAYLEGSSSICGGCRGFHVNLESCIWAWTLLDPDIPEWPYQGVSMICEPPGSPRGAFFGLRKPVWQQPKW